MIDMIYNIDEASARLGISKITLYKILKSKQIKSKRLGNRWIIAESYIQAFLDSDNEEETFSNIEDEV